MSVLISGKFLGKKFVEVTHGPSGATIVTDAPKDNEGEGSGFSPTDLVAAALGSCMLTIMVNVAARTGLILDGAHFTVEKHMITGPGRRIGALPIQFHLPAGLSPESRDRLERAAKTCPVHHSIHPDISVPLTFLYDL